MTGKNDWNEIIDMISCENENDSVNWECKFHFTPSIYTAKK